MDKREKTIRITVTNHEYELIQNYAGRLKMQVNPYVRRVALNPTIKVFDHRVVSDHTKVIGEIRNSINRLIFTIEATNNYLPREIETIVNYMNEIFETENKLLETIIKMRK